MTNKSLETIEHMRNEQTLQQPLYANDRMAAYQHGPIPNKSTLTGVKSYEGESIEQRVEKILNNNEPITDGAPQIYTERGDGINPAYDIRTDRFEVALDMTIELQNRAAAARTKRQEAQTRANDPNAAPKPDNLAPNPTNAPEVQK